MPTVDERLASLDTKVEAMNDLRPLITNLRSELHQQLTELRGEMHRNLADIRSDMNIRFGEVNGRIGVLDAKVDRQFLWLMGMMLTGFTAVIGALIAISYR